MTGIFIALSHLPSVYKSFVEENYISILAITLAYTNPFKFSHFVVSLAHHVLAAWFLRTKIAFRQKHAVAFIRNVSILLVLYCSAY